jgi:hypothetical protein
MEDSVLLVQCRMMETIMLLIRYRVLVKTMKDLDRKRREGWSLEDLEMAHICRNLQINKCLYEETLMESLRGYGDGKLTGESHMLEESSRESDLHQQMAELVRLADAQMRKEPQNNLEALAHPSNCLVVRSLLALADVLLIRGRVHKDKSYLIIVDYLLEAAAYSKGIEHLSIEGDNSHIDQILRGGERSREMVLTGSVQVVGEMLAKKREQLVRKQVV